MHYICMRKRHKEQERRQGVACACMYISLCVQACRVCILFMARNQLSLAHNGNVNSPEHLSPTRGENWLGAGCIFPIPNSEKGLARLKSHQPPPFPPSLKRFTALPIHYSKQVIQTGLTGSLKTYSHAYAHTCYAYTHTHTCRFSG